MVARASAGALDWPRVGSVGGGPVGWGWPGGRWGGGGQVGEQIAVGPGAALLAGAPGWGGLEGLEAALVGVEDPEVMGDPGEGAQELDLGAAQEADRAAVHVLSGGVFDVGEGSFDGGALVVVVLPFRGPVVEALAGLGGHVGGMVMLCWVQHFGGGSGGWRMVGLS